MTAKGPELWKKAKKIIPGGNQLLSKRSERFLPDLWPSYYTKAKGCEVWDLEGDHYYDFAQMGVGSCILGYADDDVDAAVIKAIQNGSMCTLNCPEEVELAEKLVSLHPWAEMVRFARSGGEACAIAIRIARAASGKSKVAFCGYHGWHDWYLSANLGDASNLDGQLLPGLLPLGVPRELRETALPFNYNHIGKLQELVNRYPGEIGVIIMEPLRHTSPEPGFLEAVRNIATQIGAVLIFDEVTSGFRKVVGGIHLDFGVEPDMAVLGKALGNGFPISAIIGRREVMESVQDTFISSTFWTERIGFAAALATIRKMERDNVQHRINNYGETIRQGLEMMSTKHNLDIDITGIASLMHFAFKAERPDVLQTLYTQEMLDCGFLLGSAIYATYAYTEEIIDRFIAASDHAFQIIDKAILSGEPQTWLKGAVASPGFKRLT
jgi:glutamate-1-semialdehyde aminotransferase